MPSRQDTSPGSPRTRSAQSVRMPIGVSDFADLVRNGYIFADKSLLIEEILQSGSKLTLITRPRRFGKTLNLSMLQHFLAHEVDGQPTGDLFGKLAIAGRPDTMAHQGQYSVIFLSFKDLGGATFDECETNLRELLAELYQQFPELESADLNPARRKQVDAILNQEASLPAMERSVKLLSELLFKHHGKRVVILLDEYDTPIHDAYANGYYPKLIRSMKKLLGAALKDNRYLFKAIVSGILRIAKESMFSGVNNADVQSVLDGKYSAYFGFTEVEVKGLLTATGLAARRSALEGQIKDWYNGYRFGQEIIYNPWSIVNCLDKEGALQPWWVNTGGDDILKDLMARADAGFKERLEHLIRGETVEEIVDRRMVFGDLDSDSTSLWSLMLFSGYLTAETVSFETDGSERGGLRIPNREIAGIYRRYIKEWFTQSMKLDGYRDFLEGLAKGGATGFESRLRHYLLHTASFFDPQGDEPEKFYHGLVLGMMVGLEGTHDIRSNRESGLGRYDAAIFPRAGSGYDVGVLLEFKSIGDPERLQAAADEALTQIDRGHYRAEFERHPVQRILSMGLAFSGKEMAAAHRMETSDPTTHLWK